MEGRILYVSWGFQKLGKSVNGLLGFCCLTLQMAIHSCISVLTNVPKSFVEVRQRQINIDVLYLQNLHVFRQFFFT